MARAPRRLASSSGRSTGSWPTPEAFDLDRFVAAQAAGVFEQALREVRGGRKTSHWMWFIYPQLRGLGRSEASIQYGIASLDEARAYLAHPLLGPRLLEAAAAVLGAPRGETVVDILGPIDAQKLQSSMTLFASAAEDPSPFQRVLDRHFDGRRDAQTEAMLAGG